ncbi:unnamed protein product, partial [Didymodactylos carnosus]
LREKARFGSSLGLASPNVLACDIPTVLCPILNVSSGLVYGGSGGGPFNDSSDINDNCPLYPSRIYFTADSDGVSEIQMTYTTADQSSAIQLSVRGGYSSAQDSETLILDKDERIIKVNGIAGQLLMALQFHTNKGRRTRLLGRSDGSSWSEGGGDTCVFSYLNGRSGNSLDQIQLNFIEADPGMVISTIPRVICSTAAAAAAANVVYWSLSGDTLSMFNTLYNAQTVNNPVYSSGYSFPIALLLTKANKQYAIAQSIEVFTSAFTVEAWINLNSVNTAGYMSIIGQCADVKNCMYIGILNGSLFMSWGAGEYQLLYLNGGLVGQGATTTITPSSSGGNITIGTTQDENQLETYFDGKIGQILISSGLKTPQEILEDATLIAYYTFGCDGYVDFQQDSGPNYMDGTGSDVIATSANGIHDHSLWFNISTSYFQISNLVAFGQGSQPFSILLWLRPSDITGGTIIHASPFSSGTGFCYPYMGLSNTGSIVVQLYNGNVVSVTGPILQLNQWTHIAQTFSPSHGLQLYVNGTLAASNSMSSYNTNNSPFYFTLGNSRAGAICVTAGITIQPYTGQMDEVRFYSRELSNTEILPLL